MLKVTTNAGEVAATYAGRMARFPRALHLATQAVLIALNRAQIRNVSGSGASNPGAYPVPVRSGNLRRSMDWGFTGNASGYIVAGGNNAPYAIPIHEGTGSSAKFGPRHFQTDAGESVDVMAVMLPQIEGALA